MVVVSQHCYFNQFSGLAKDLPDNVHLLTVEHLEEKKILLRLENQFQADEPTPKNMSTDVTIDAKVLWNVDLMHIVVAKCFLPACA